MQIKKLYDSSFRFASGDFTSSSLIRYEADREEFSKRIGDSIAAQMSAILSDVVVRFREGNYRVSFIIEKEFE